MTSGWAFVGSYSYEEVCELGVTTSSKYEIWLGDMYWMRAVYYEKCCTNSSAFIQFMLHEDLCKLDSFSSAILSYDANSYIWLESLPVFRMLKRIIQDNNMGEQRLHCKPEGRTLRCCRWGVMTVYPHTFNLYLKDKYNN
mmetsp:Transcript_34143/g.82560  ORF Transcript_34143/g.82560 Transcript_34143/m.82560 type:complete len:140 (-) Transcript_34143:533-952(-)